jgi:cytochrome c
VLHTTRNGRIFMHDPGTGFNRVVGTIPVYQHDEEGLQSIAVDADFADNHWVYVYYSPPLETPTDDPRAETVVAALAAVLGVALHVDAAPVTRVELTID